MQLFGLGAVALVLVGVWWFWPKGPQTTNAAELDGVFEPASAPETVAQGPANRRTTTPRTTPQTEPQATPPVVAMQASADPVANTTLTSELGGEPMAAIDAPPSAMPQGANTGASTDPTNPATTTAFTPPPAPVSPAVSAIEEARRLLDRNDPVRARDVLNRALHNTAVSEAERVELRKRLSEIAEMVTFSSRVFPGDPMADTYVIASGDRLSKIPAREGFRTDYRLLQRLNGIKDANTIRVGQKLKALYGPFHAVVDKSDFRMDIFADQKDTAGNPVFVTSFRVGLGEMGSTPIGSWKVRTNSKLIDPKWVNPRTGEVFQAADPKNPIGERWIGLIGTDPQTSLLEGYGIHGTIDPASIGREMSMGCVRLADDDVEVVYELLIDDLSTVRIVP
jgi:lipoprotein-anchoring transpeptidase ErfK/SrfK